MVYILVTLADSLSKCPVVQLLQSMFDMSALCASANTSTQMVSPCIDSSVNNVLLQTNPDFNQSLLEFTHILERRLIDPLLHEPPELVIDHTEVRAVGSHRPREIKAGVLCSNSSIVLRADALVHCPAETRTCHQSPVTRLIAGSTIVSK